MGRYVEISKEKTAFNVHYYKVVAHDHPEIQPFYIGLDELNHQVSFYTDITDPAEILISKSGNIHYLNQQIKDQIPSWLIFLCFKKAQDAFLSKKFLCTMSFQS